MCEKCQYTAEYIDEKALTHFAHYYGIGGTTDAYYCNTCKQIYHVEVYRDNEYDNLEVKEIEANELILKDIAFYRLLPEAADCLHAQSMHSEEEVFRTYGKMLTKDLFEKEMRKLRKEFNVE